MISVPQMDNQHGMEMLVKICALLKRNLRSFSGMDRVKMGAIIAWHASRSQVAYVTKNGKILAVGIARGVRSAIHARDAYHTDDNSQLVWVDWSVCKSREALPSLLVGLRCRFPNVRHIVFSRQKNEHKVKQYDFDKFFNLAKIGASYGR